MILKRRNVIKRTDNLVKAGELKALGYEEVVTTSIEERKTTDPVMSDPATEVADVETESMTKAELMDLAEAEGVEVSRKMTKKELIEALKEV